ncbi:hypothetical protein DICPUDRAFT_78832 [Dictyostelium purpureum]|uniref:Rab GTPase n=1 Tax=Dictyostelium purpureum TaxID=5786 RepID=F0ZKQ1_DICPU|nr:uncharacterized protein DICPUDRAFT_78832 [Dictyostelium purpureum]EGC35467.1 hypothetical protein DICPUDRAFT_78832 [Dictyostelium purpureum]|eukprot:XP_003288010.1 hypothetical protein DICPUDRAFT_78832 [Dictyostelium purpureum]
MSTKNNNNNNNNNKFKVLLVGNFKVGKTSILLKYVDGEFTENYIATIGIDFKVKNIEIDNESLKFILWDHPRGCDRLRTITSAYYRNLNGIIFVYDITDKKSFSSIQSIWYPECKKYSPDKAYIPSILILGTKSDLRNQSNYKECVDTDQAREYAASIKALFFEVSSKENLNLDSSLLELFTQIKNNDSRTLDQNKNDQIKKQKSSCIIN